LQFLAKSARERQRDVLLEKIGCDACAGVIPAVRGIDYNEKVRLSGRSGYLRVQNGKEGKRQ
jgi:hypothetical protein